jgi:hypothetical protein
MIINLKLLYGHDRYSRQKHQRKLSRIHETPEKPDSPWWHPKFPPRSDGLPQWISVLEWDCRRIRSQRKPTVKPETSQTKVPTGSP